MEGIAGRQVVVDTVGLQEVVGTAGLQGIGTGWAAADTVSHQVGAVVVVGKHHLADIQAGNKASGIVVEGTPEGVEGNLDLYKGREETLEGAEGIPDRGAAAEVVVGAAQVVPAVAAQVATVVTVGFAEALVLDFVGEPAVARLVEGVAVVASLPRLSWTAPIQESESTGDLSSS